MRQSIKGIGIDDDERHRHSKTDHAAKRDPPTDLITFEGGHRAAPAFGDGPAVHGNTCITSLDVSSDIKLFMLW